MKRCSMFGTFNLRSETDIAAFKRSFDGLCAHLKTEGYLHSWRVWERVYHEGYDARFPSTSVILEMCFHDDAASYDNWDYIQSGGEPVRSLHAAVTRQVTDAHFVLCREL